MCTAYIRKDGDYCYAQHSLADDITSAPSLSTFRRHLKTYLFRCCCNTLWYCSYLLWL